MGGAWFPAFSLQRAGLTGAPAGGGVDVNVGRGRFTPTLPAVENGTLQGEMPFGVGVVNCFPTG